MAEEIEQIVAEEKQHLELNLGTPNTADRTESES